MTKFAEQLKKLRTEKQFSQDDIAKECFISRQAVSKWENGEASPDLDTLVKLASIFEVSLDELVTGVKPIPAVLEKSDKNRPMNAWEFLADYWWIVIPIGGFLSWFIPYTFG